MSMQYQMMKQKGALNEVAASEQAESQGTMAMATKAELDDYVAAHRTPPGAIARRVRATNVVVGPEGLQRGVWFTTVEEGHRALVTYRDGQVAVMPGPARVWSPGRKVRPMVRWVAHPGEFLVVRFRDGRQSHHAGPADVWFDPREHQAIEKEDVLRLDAKEAVVVYAKGEDGTVKRRIVHGPCAFVPEPGEWLHTFSWHGSRWNGTRYLKIPNALVFQKLWLMPDQMYHDVPDVRTADDAVITIRLMVFFELVDIEKMLDGTHDPVGDFVNATTSDIIDWVGRLDFDGFKRSTGELNEVATYRELASRAQHSGYRIHKVVYRGYGATDSLQRMHDEAIESRTRLKLERATEQQSQELIDFKLGRDHARQTLGREQEAQQVLHDIAIARQRQEAELKESALRSAHERHHFDATEQQRQAHLASREAALRQHLDGLGKLGVDLTRVLTHSRADHIVELRADGATPHLHLEGVKS